MTWRQNLIFAGILLHTILDAEASPDMSMKRQKINKDHRYLFFLGPGRTGTGTMTAILKGVEPLLKCKPCHNFCDEHDVWKLYTVSPDRSPKHILFHEYCAFIDNAVKVDFQWLDKVFPDARFVLQTRQMKELLRSRLGHIRRIHDTPVKNPADFLRNFVLHVAAHQKAVMEYFSAKSERLNRFARMQITEAPMEDTAEILTWVFRTDPNRRKVKSVVKDRNTVPRRVQRAVDVPEGFIPLIGTRYLNDNLVYQSIMHAASRVPSVHNSTEAALKLKQQGEEVPPEEDAERIAIAVVAELGCNGTEQLFYECPRVARILESGSSPWK
eukprot:m.21178 g.21178  ORF g.21178 m.21178 type:complete len:327 (+) comp7065_c0_seq1:123-1103(+)